MFFLKRTSAKDKEEEKEKKKKEKLEKEQQKQAANALKMTADELFRLEEAKTALQRKQSLSAEASGGASPLPRAVKPIKPGSSPRIDTGSKKAPPVTQPKPQKKGILKDKSNYGGQIPNQGVRGSLDDTVTVEENTLANEILSGHGLDDAMLPSGIVESASSTPAKPIPAQRSKPTPSPRLTQAKSTMPIDDRMAKSSPLSAPRPPSPVDKTYDDLCLCLPELTPPFFPKPRELILRRQPAGDFGVALRKGVIVCGNGSESAAIFVEPCAGAASRSASAGLLPGDRLLRVNDENVEGATREVVADMMKKCRDSVRLTVQLGPELAELSAGCAVDGREGVEGGAGLEGGGRPLRSGSKQVGQLAAAAFIGLRIR